jgi:hypothetical protein
LVYAVLRYAVIFPAGSCPKLC